MLTYGYLAHHGVKGMKWGIRRYQTENGTLTPEGRKRYGLDGPKMQGTLKDRAKALRTAAKNLDSQRKADYDADVRSIKDTYKGKERRQQIKKYNEYYNTGQKYAQKSVKEALSKKYGSDAWNKVDKQETAKAVGALSLLAVGTIGMLVGENIMARN